MVSQKGEAVRKRKGVGKPPQLDNSTTTNNRPSPVIRPETTKTPKGSCQRCLAVTKYMLLFIAIPPFLNYAALNMESKQLQPQGALYDVGQGQKLFLSCKGKGKPTVLLDAPTGLSSDVWSLVQDQLSSLTTVCTYDRAGIGFSERPPFQNASQRAEEQSSAHSRWQEYTVERMADDLHRLVTFSTQQVDKPFVYVGSELGALVARFYTQLYEGDVSDLVLLDPLVEGLFELDDKVWEQFWYGQLVPSAQTMQISAAAGFSRFALMLGLVAPPLQAAGIPENVTARQKHLLCNPRHLSSVVDEHHFMMETFSQMQTVFRLKPFPTNVSVTVVTGNYYDEQLPSALNKAWAKSTQLLLTQLHPGSHHIVVNGADHHMLYKQAADVAEPIRRVVRQARTRR